MQHQRHEQHEPHQQHIGQSCTQLLDLPDECLLHVLKQLGSDARTCCSAARTNSRMRQAAATALSTIVTGQLAAHEQLCSLEAYLEQHGQHVTSLGVEALMYHFRRLPATPVRVDLVLQRLPSRCSQLQRLSLTGLHVQLGAGRDSNTPLGVLHGLPQLTKLSLNECSVLDQVDNTVEPFEAPAAVVSSLTGLRSLQLGLIGLSDNAITTGTGKKFEMFCSPGMLHALANLTRLSLMGNGWDASALVQNASRLEQLCELHVLFCCIKQTITAGAFAGLGHLTKLRLNCGCYTYNSPMYMEPELLAGVAPNLQCLWLCNVRLTRMDDSVLDGLGASTSLLAQLAAMQQLTHLTLRDTLRFGCVVDASAFSALTASSRLQVLQLLGSCVMWPATTWQHMFAGRVLPDVRHLALDLDIVDNQVHTVDVEQVVCYCPALQSLSLFVAPDTQLHALLQLTQLTHLSLRGISADAPTVAQLRELASFTCDVAGG